MKKPLFIFATVALLGGAPLPFATADIVVLPDITITSLGHAHSSDPFFGNSTVDGVSIPSGYIGGTYTTNGFTGEAHGGDTITEQILAPAGQKFVVNFDPAYSSLGLGISIYWQAGGDSSSTFVAPTITFQNLIGAAPTPTYSLAAVGDAGNVISYEYMADIVGSLSFTGLTVSFPVLNSPPGGSRSFSIGSNSDPSFYAYGSSADNFDSPILALEQPSAVPEAPAWLALGIVGVCTVLGITVRRAFARTTAS